MTNMRHSPIQYKMEAARLSFLIQPLLSPPQRNRKTTFHAVAPFASYRIPTKFPVRKFLKT